MDADSLIHIAHPEDGHSRVAAISVLKVAIRRIVESYRQLGIKQTFFVPAWCIERYPAAIEATLAGGHELAHHGFLHQHPRELSDEDEAYWLDRSIDVIVKASGRRPGGWRAPLYNFSHRSADLLVSSGFEYDASLMGDDIPYLLECDAGPQADAAPPCAMSVLIDGAVAAPRPALALSRLAPVSGASGNHQCGFRTLSVIASARVSAAREGLLRG
ncbi:polysaccharide deacetylase family protein [Ensifer sp. 4252]|uniref:polysaccharide deacetylase family protein n=1 Tax=Ensifer sp. 4252 TaxID=3373915 RepID=UPI003D1928EA